MVVPSGSTITTITLPLTAATAAGVSISYFDSWSVSFCTRLIVLPISLFNPIVVEPASAIPRFETSSIVGPISSIVLPSKNVTSASELSPVLMASSGCRVIPITAGTQVVVPARLTKTSPVIDRIVIGGDRRFVFGSDLGALGKVVEDEVS